MIAGAYCAQALNSVAADHLRAALGYGKGRQRIAPRCAAIRRVSLLLSKKAEKLSGGLHDT
jgi:hypothetical protein